MSRKTNIQTEQFLFTFIDVFDSPFLFSLIFVPISFSERHLHQLLAEKKGLHYHATRGPLTLFSKGRLFSSHTYRYLIAPIKNK